MKLTDDDAACVAEFGRRKRIWLWVAVPAALLLLLSIATQVDEHVSVLQIIGLGMLILFIAASALLCRCPHCGKFVLDKKDLVPGWGLTRCPHCGALLREERQSKGDV